MLAGDYQSTASLLRELRGDAQRASAATLAEYRQIAGLPADFEGEPMSVPTPAGGAVPPPDPVG